MYVLSECYIIKCCVETFCPGVCFSSGIIQEDDESESAQVSNFFANPQLQHIDL